MLTPQSPHKPTILLVDDHPNNLVALEAVLGTSNYHLITAASGQEALDLVDKHEFAVILLDIHMPGIDGYEVARRIKTLPHAKNVPIFMITAIYKEDPYVQKAYDAGAVEYFSKPFNTEVLKLKVGIYAELYQKNLAIKKIEDERLAMEEKLSHLNRTLEERGSQRRRDEERRAAELSAILESVPDAIYIGDQKGITRCNEKALAMFGFDSCHELNQHFEKLAERVVMRYPDSEALIPPRDQPFSHALRGEQFLSKIKIRHRSSGEDRTIACAAAPVKFHDEIIGAVVVNSEVPRGENGWPT